MLTLNSWLAAGGGGGDGDSDWGCWSQGGSHAKSWDWLNLKIDKMSEKSIESKGFFCWLLPRRIEGDETLNLPWRDCCEREEGVFAPKPHWCLARLAARWVLFYRGAKDCEIRMRWYGYNSLSIFIKNIIIFLPLFWILHF